MIQFFEVVVFYVTAIFAIQLSISSALMIYSQVHLHVKIIRLKHWVSHTSIY